MPQVGTANYTCKLIPDFQDASSAMRAALCVVVAWLSLDAFAATDSVEGLRPQPVPEPTALLVDEAGALTQTERETIAARLKAIQSSGRAQVAVLISHGLGGEPLAAYALRVAEKWELGRERRDDGLLVLVVPSVPAARIEVGYGLEGDASRSGCSRQRFDCVGARARGESRPDRCGEDRTWRSVRRGRCRSQRVIRVKADTACGMHAARPGVLQDPKWRDE